MDDSAPIESRIAIVDAEIAQTKGNISRVKNSLAPFKREAASMQRRLTLLRLVRRLREPATSYELWKIGFVIVGSAVVSIIFYVIADLTIASRLTAMVGVVIGAALSAYALTMVQYIPSDGRLTEQIVEAEIQSKVADSRLTNQQDLDGLQGLEERLKSLLGEKCNLLVQLRREIASGINHRRLLLQQNWKAMRDDAWEEFLVKVFTALGAKARRIGRSGDQGVDLIVEKDVWRIAVQAKGYLNPVGNGAIQEAFTGMRHYGCNACAVITNSRFTKSARDVSVTTCCILIGEDEFPDLVIGNLTIEQLCANGTN